jgi:hypothetical protein
VTIAVKNSMVEFKIFGFTEIISPAITLQLRITNYEC